MRVRGKPHTSGKMVNRSNLIVLKGKGDCTLTQEPQCQHFSVTVCPRVSVSVRFNVNMSASQPVSMSGHLHIGMSAC